MKGNPHGEVAIDVMQLDSVPLAEHLVPRRQQAPEHELTRAVLQDALDCVEKYRLLRRASIAS